MASSSARPPGPSQPVALRSDAQPGVTPPANPQLGAEALFTYPIPTAEELVEGLPPSDPTIELQMGVILKRLMRQGYGEMKTLLEHSLPDRPSDERALSLISYAQRQRQAALKYLAILRWKNEVDVPKVDRAAPSPALLGHPQTTHTQQYAGSFPTPISNGESNSTSPAGDSSVGSKGKARASGPNEDDRSGTVRSNDAGTMGVVTRGRVTDAARVQHFMKHQIHQQMKAIEHIKHVIKGIETLRVRNSDLLTAISLAETGTYTRLPTGITEAFIERPKLTNRFELRTLHSLNRRIRYRLTCLDYLPPEITVESVRGGKAYIRGGGAFGWKVHLTLTGFGEAEEARWWMTGLEWMWKRKDRGTDDPGGKRFEGEERQHILDAVNGEVLVSKALDESTDAGPSKQTGSVTQVETESGVGTSASGKPERRNEAIKLEQTEKVDAPLVRLANYLQHLSLSYQLEVLFTQAMLLRQSRWREQLAVDLKRDKKSLTLKYWLRQRPLNALQQQAQLGKRPPQPLSGASRHAASGGTISVTLGESAKSISREATLMRETTAGGREPNERVLGLELSIGWDVGEAGIGGGLKAGHAMDAAVLVMDPVKLDIETVLATATSIHASHLSRALTTPLLTSPRIALFPSNPPTLITPESSLALVLRVPMPSRQRTSALLVSVSSATGLIEIEDQSGIETRMARAKMAAAGINESRIRLTDDIGRLITAVITENLEGQMRQLGWKPIRRLSLRSQDMPKNDLFPASTVLVTLPASSMNYFVAKVTPQGIVFEILRLVRVVTEGGIGHRMAIGDRSPIDMAKFQSGRKGTSADEPNPMSSGTGGVKRELSGSEFEIKNRDLHDAFVFANGLVAQMIIEQQLKDRSIPYSLQLLPMSGKGAPLSSSAIAGMMPVFVVSAQDLLKDDRAADVAMPRVYMQLRDWWTGAKCQVVTIIQLRHKPSLSTAGTSPGLASASSVSVKTDGITFDPVTSHVRFQASDITRCVPTFLEQWKRLSKVIVVASAVNRLNKSEEFKDLQMISFDLRTATFRYAPGHTAAITYTPSDGSYDGSFDAEAGVNPHAALAGLFSERLNELAVKVDNKDSVGRDFISLLRHTLPFLCEVHDLRPSPDHFPKLVIRSVERYRLIWDMEFTRRYALDVSFMPASRVLLQDGSANPDSLCGPLTCLPAFEAVIADAFERLRTSKTGTPKAIRLDSGRSLVCNIESIRDVLRGVTKDVEGKIGFER